MAPTGRHRNKKWEKGNKVSRAGGHYWAAGSRASEEGYNYLESQIYQAGSTSIPYLARTLATASLTAIRQSSRKRSSSLTERPAACALVPSTMRRVSSDVS